MYAGGTAAAVRGPQVEGIRESGRIEMARRRLADMRDRMEVLTGEIHSELDRVMGHRPPSNEKLSGQGTPAVNGEVHALDIELDLLSGLMIALEDVRTRVRGL